MRAAVEGVKIVAQGVGVDQAFGRQFEPLHEQPETLDAGHHAVHLLADAVAEIGQQLELGEFAFGRFGPLLAVGAMLAEHQPLVEIVARFVPARISCSWRWIVRSG